MKVIAEVGSNFKSTDDCLQSIRLAKEAGADIVKFQYFTGKDLYGPEYTGMRESKVDIPLLAIEARKQRIELMCSAFSPAGYRAIDPYVVRHKVASSEITAVDILDTLNALRKPVILSTGGADHDEIRSALMVLRNVPVTLMYCVVEYPATVIDFRHYDLIRGEFGSNCKMGYSDHSIDVMNIPKIAKQRGADVIEKHVNFCGYTDTPDAPHSLNFENFRLMIRNLKNKVRTEETFKPNPWKRKIITLPNGTYGYYRPRPDE